MAGMHDKKMRPMFIGLGLTGFIALGSAAFAQDPSGPAPAPATAGMAHESPASRAMIDELKSKVPLYKDFTDQQLALSMQRMGGNFAVYMSDPSMTGAVGMLVLTHGFGGKGNEVFKSQVGQMASVFPTSIAFGMSMLTSAHIQTALDQLAAAGVKRIIVIPALSTSHNSLLRQWEYIFGMRDKAEYATVPRVHTKAKITFAPPLDDNPLVAEAMLDFANGLSTDPANEVVILIAHGPTAQKDNAAELATLATLAGYMKQDGAFSDVKWLTLQDDAPRKIRDKNVAALRQMVAEESAAGHQVLIVSNLMATRSIQSKIRKDLKGLNYKFASEGLTEHPNFVKWLGDVMHDELLP